MALFPPLEKNNFQAETLFGKDVLYTVRALIRLAGVVTIAARKARDNRGAATSQME